MSTSPQLAMFNEAEELIEESGATPSGAEAKEIAVPIKRRGKRKPPPINLLRVVAATASAPLARPPARWMIQFGEQLQPLLRFMRDTLREHPVLHCDETHLQVLHEPGRDPIAESWM
ncbi:transposase [Pseudomonas sp. J452]|uniref:IS66 family transposase n=1 Tax=Pseudomonas sp. J452 TaxID=2898441 RepID=UPI003917F303